MQQLRSASPVFVPDGDEPLNIPFFTPLHPHQAAEVIPLIPHIGHRHRSSLRQPLRATRSPLNRGPRNLNLLHSVSGHRPWSQNCHCDETLISPCRHRQSTTSSHCAARVTIVGFGGQFTCLSCPWRARLSGTSIFSRYSHPCHSERTA